MSYTPTDWCERCSTWPSTAFIIISCGCHMSRVTPTLEWPQRARSHVKSSFLRCQYIAVYGVRRLNAIRSTIPVFHCMVTSDRWVFASHKYVQQTHYLCHRPRIWERGHYKMMTVSVPPSVRLSVACLDRTRERKGLGSPNLAGYIEPI